VSFCPFVEDLWWASERPLCVIFVQATRCTRCNCVPDGERRLQLTHHSSHGYRKVPRATGSAGGGAERLLRYRAERAGAMCGCAPLSRPRRAGDGEVTFLDPAAQKLLESAAAGRPGAADKLTAPLRLTVDVAIEGAWTIGGRAQRPHAALRAAQRRARSCQCCWPSPCRRTSRTRRCAARCSGATCCGPQRSR
jgi:hypothetical protein